MTWRRRCFSPIASLSSATARRASRPTSRSIVPIRGIGAIQTGGTAPGHSGATRIGRDMVSAKGGSIREEHSMDATPTIFDTASLLAAEFAAARGRARSRRELSVREFRTAVRGGIAGADRADGTGRPRRRRARCGPHRQHFRQSRCIDRAGAVDALHPAPVDGAKHPLAGAALSASSPAKPSKAWR